MAIYHIDFTLFIDKQTLIIHEPAAKSITWGHGTAMARLKDHNRLYNCNNNQGVQVKHHETAAGESDVKKEPGRFKQET